MGSGLCEGYSVATLPMTSATYPGEICEKISVPIRVICGAHPNHTVQQTPQP